MAHTYPPPITATPAAGTVTLAMLADLATDKLIGRVSALTGVPEAVTFTDAGQAMAAAADAAAQTALLNLATSAAGLKGLVRLGVEVPKRVQLAADVSDNTNGLVDSGLAFTLDANSTYFVQFFGAFDTAATTTGIQFAFIAPTGGVYATEYLVAPASGTSQALRISATSAAVLGTGTNALTDNPCWGWALIQTGAAPVGDLKLQFRTEIAASLVTLKSGSFMLATRILPVP